MVQELDESCGDLRECRIYVSVKYVTSKGSLVESKQCTKTFSEKLQKSRVKKGDNTKASPVQISIGDGIVKYFLSK